MRSVFVFPAANMDDVRRQMARLASDVIYVSIATTADRFAPLYCDWEPSAVEELRAAVGHVPRWSVVCDVSGRIPGDTEIRSVVLELLADGGVAVDDYSDHCWTAAEIAEDRRVGGLRFFDYA